MSGASAGKVRRLGWTFMVRVSSRGPFIPMSGSWCWMKLGPQLELLARTSTCGLFHVVLSASSWWLGSKSIPKRPGENYHLWWHSIPSPESHTHLDSCSLRSVKSHCKSIGMGDILVIILEINLPHFLSICLSRFPFLLALCFLLLLSFSFPISPFFLTFLSSVLLTLIEHVQWDMSDPQVQVTPTSFSASCSLSQYGIPA